MGKRGKHKKKEQKIGSRFSDPYHGSMNPTNVPDTHQLPPTRSLNTQSTTITEKSSNLLNLNTMFPHLEKEILQQILDECKNDFDKSLEILLEMNEGVDKNINNKELESNIITSPIEGVYEEEVKEVKEGGQNGLVLTEGELRMIGKENENNWEENWDKKDFRNNIKSLIPEWFDDTEYKMGSYDNFINELVKRESDEMIWHECEPPGTDLLHSSPNAHIFQIEPNPDPFFDEISLRFVDKYPQYEFERVYQIVREENGNIVNTLARLEAAASSNQKPHRAQSSANERNFKEYQMEEKDNLKDFYSENLEPYNYGESVEFKEFYGGEMGNIQNNIYETIKTKEIPKEIMSTDQLEKEYPAIEGNTIKSIGNSQKPTIGEWSRDKQFFVKEEEKSEEYKKYLHECFPLLDQQIIDFVYLSMGTTKKSMEYLKAQYAQYYSSHQAVHKPPKMAITEYPRERPYLQNAPPKNSKSHREEGWSQKKGKIKQPRTPNNLRVENSGPNYSYRELREEAKEYLNAMRAYFTAANSAFATGHHAEAHRLSSKGAEYKRKYNSSKVKAMEATYSQKNAYNDVWDKLDLHGLHAPEALHYVRQTIKQIIQYRREHGHQKPHFLQIVTGKGIHSRGVPVLQPTILKYLLTVPVTIIQYKYETNEGVFHVKIL